MATDDGKLEDRLEEVADGPLQASNETGSVTQHSLKALIEADKYLQSKKSQAASRPGIRLGRFTPGGSV